MLSDLFLNLGLSVFEVLGGLLKNSLATLSDAVHDFSHSISLGLAVYLERKSEQPENERYTYGV